MSNIKHLRLVCPRFTPRCRSPINTPPCSLHSFHHRETQLGQLS
jgi:hypothetical protein